MKSVPAPTPRCISADPGLDEPVGIAVIGLGYWGPNLLRVIAEKPEAEVRWICDLDAERLQRAKRRYPRVRTTTKVERALPIQPSTRS